MVTLPAASRSMLPGAFTDEEPSSTRFSSPGGESATVKRMLPFVVDTSPTYRLPYVSMRYTPWSAWALTTPWVGLDESIFRSWVDVPMLPLFDVRLMLTP